MLNLAQRYDFEWNVWETMASLPGELDYKYSCCSLYGDLILITSYHLQKIISYSTKQNSYEDIPNLVLSADCHKFILRGNNRIYLIEKAGRIFESDENDISSWKNIGSSSIPNNNPFQSCIVRYKGYLYFVHYPNQLWRFDLSSKQVLYVANV